MDYHLLDDNHIEVLAGDIAPGVWNFAGEAITRDGDETIQLENNTRSLQMRLKRQVGRIDTVSDLPLGGLVGVAFALIWGPIGGLAASLASKVVGTADFFCIGCQLKDGRKFIAYMRNTVYDRWCKSCPDVKKTTLKK